MGINSINLNHVVIIAALVFLSACNLMPVQKMDTSVSPVGLSFQIPEDAQMNDLRDPFVEAGINALNEDDLQRATAAFNHALKLDPDNPYLHFLNAYTYHLMTHQGDSSKADMASVGYGLARQFDSSAWWNEYFHGVLALESRDYDLAQQLFARALLLEEDNAEIMKGLITASYYLGDIDSALYVLEPALALNENDPAMTRIAALVLAASGDNVRALQYLADYDSAGAPGYKVKHIAERIRDWQKFHRDQTGNLIKATDAEQNADDDSDNTSTTSSAGDSDRQVVVDVVIIRSEERASDRRGINLLDGLSISFGVSQTFSGTDLGPPLSATGGRISDNSVAAANDAGAEEFNTFAFPSVFTSSISIPNVTYSLNIFNTIGDSNEILAKPSLMALDGEKSTFFSGAELSIGFAGTLQGGNLETKEVGVTLDVTPQFISDERVKLTVKAERDFFEDFSPGTFEQSVQTSKNTVTASAIMNFGQTLILSGLTEKETQALENKVPILGDIPLIKTFFNQSTDVEFNKSILFMLTPRKLSFVNEPNETIGEEINKKEIIRNLLKQWRTSSASVNLTNPSKLNEMQLSRYVRVSDMTYKGWENQANIARAVNTAVQRLYD